MINWSVLILFLIGALANPVAGNAQRARPRGAVDSPERQQRRDSSPPAARTRRPLPPQLQEKLDRLPAEERERVLENNRRFRELPPAQQNLLRRRLQQLQDLSPDQRELIEQRFAIFSNLSSGQQEKARRIYEDAWSKLTVERRRALLGEFRHLRALPPAEQERRLDSDEVQNHFSADERKLLKELTDL
jgi:hypothetical protein